MFSFLRKKDNNIYAYDSDKERPILHVSICTGETAFGYKDIVTGKFREVCLIKSDKDIEKIKSVIKVNDIPKEY